MKGMNFEEWQDTIKNREQIVANNIIKSQSNELDKPVEVNHRGLSELTDQELLDMMVRFGIGEVNCTDVSEKQKYKQALDMIQTEIKKRK